MGFLSFVSNGNSVVGHTCLSRYSRGHSRTWTRLLPDNERGKSTPLSGRPYSVPTRPSGLDSKQKGWRSDRVVEIPPRSRPSLPDTPTGVEVEVSPADPHVSAHMRYHNHCSDDPGDRSVRGG